ncbi:hypothetical protein GJ496_006026 [Pomphorhynchus laevis]|nr:hypothetical protein GJ496_006026 [Pomphorhynchus laevis]
MKKICSRCSKQVYPTEEINCLDKYWHKCCFRCTVCAMPLTMKSYKGYAKLPYCNVHYPTQKPTVVTDNPEMERLRKNTVIQSNIKYHEEFERSRGKFTSVSQDPEFMRNMKSHLIADSSYFTKNGINKHSFCSNDNESDKSMSREEPHGNSVQSVIQTHELTVKENKCKQRMNNSKQQGLNLPKVGSIADYDPLSGQYGSLTKGYLPKYQESQFVSRNDYEELSEKNYRQLDNASTNAVSSMSDTILTDNINYINVNSQEFVKLLSCLKVTQICLFDYINITLYSFVGISGGKQNSKDNQSQIDDIEQIKEVDITHPFNVKAIHDFRASDNDELSFKRGDIILECEYIDSGWLIGTHSQTNKCGMLPANYVRSYQNR